MASNKRRDVDKQSDVDKHDLYMEIITALARATHWGIDAPTQRPQLLEALAETDYLLGDIVQEIVARLRNGQPLNKTRFVFLMGYVAGKAITNVDLVPFSERERKRIAALQESCGKAAKTLEQEVVTVYREFAPSDIKELGKAAVYKQIGEIVAKRLELTKPISERTVRRYIRKFKKVGIESSSLFDT